MLEDLAAPVKNAIVGGPFGSNLVSKDYVESGVPVIRGQNMGGKWVSGSFVFVSPEKAEQLQQNKARPGDVVFTQRGTLGQVSIVPASPYAEYIVSQSQMKITLDPNKADAGFIYYLFKSEHQLRYILNSAIQTGVPHTNLGILRKTPVTVPSLKAQKSIAGMLCALDDRITLLRETNTSLEAIAQALFKSWFVDFDPVRAKASGLEPEGMDTATAALFPNSFEESELGWVPRGWGYSTIGQSFILTMGQSPPGDTYNETGEGLPFYQGRTDFGFRFPTQRVFCKAPTRIAETGDTLVSVRAPVGDANVALQRCAIGRGVAGIRHPEGHQSFVFYSIQILKKHFELYNGEGTVFGSINKKDFQNLPVIQSCDPVLRSFESIVAPLDSAIELNEQKLRSLTQLRDTLLPRLISGQLRLPEAEEQIETVCA